MGGTRGIIVTPLDSSDGTGANDFKTTADKIEKQMRSKGGCGAEGCSDVKRLNGLPPAGATEPADVVVFVGHGGWDGPMDVNGTQWAGPNGDQSSDGQISPWVNQKEWPDEVARLRGAVKPGGLVVVDACHGAGSNADEPYQMAGSTVSPVTPTNHHSWAQAVAKDAGVYAVGPQGTTGESWMPGMENYGVHGGAAPQQAGAYSPGGTEVKDWQNGGWAAHKKKTGCTSPSCGRPGPEVEVPAEEPAPPGRTEWVNGQAFEAPR